MEPAWLTALVAILGALGGGGIAARMYKGARVVKDDIDEDRRDAVIERREERADDIAEKVSDKIVADLIAQIERLNKENQYVREAKEKMEVALAKERTDKFALVRRLALIGRRSDITDIGIELAPDEPGQTQGRVTRKAPVPERAV